MRDEYSDAGRAPTDGRIEADLALARGADREGSDGVSNGIVDVLLAVGLAIVCLTALTHGQVLPTSSDDGFARGAGQSREGIGDERSLLLELYGQVEKVDGQRARVEGATSEGRARGGSEAETSGGEQEEREEEHYSERVVGQ